MADTITNKIQFIKSFDVTVRDYFIIRHRQKGYSFREIVKALKSVDIDVSHQTAKRVWDENTKGGDN